jgi:tripartite-type tricarboxylate transporter receptor subunit TctC
MKLILRAAMAAACICGVTSHAVNAQMTAAFPNRAMRLIVPFAPGGSTDTLARIVGQGLTASLGQAVVVDHRPAGGGIVGADLVAKLQPDGYTSLVTAGLMTR